MGLRCLESASGSNKIPKVLEGGSHYVQPTDYVGPYSSSHQAFRQYSLIKALRGSEPGGESGISGVSSLLGDLWDIPLGAGQSGYVRNMEVHDVDMVDGVQV